MKIKFVLLVSSIMVICFVQIGGAAVAEPSDLKFTSQEIELIPEARVFSGTVNGIDIVGAEVGPKDGTPLVLMGGLASNFLYLRKLIRTFANDGFRVFVFNKPGHGSGDLKSGTKVSSDYTGFAGKVSVVQGVIDFAYEESGAKPVVLAGHSLGGMVARMSSLGLQGLLEGETQISKEKQRQFASKVALIVPLLSPFIHPTNLMSEEDKKTYKSKVGAYQKMNKVLSAVRALDRLTPKFLKPARNKYLKSLIEKKQESMAGLFGTTDFDLNELASIGLQGVTESISKELIADYQRWAENLEMITKDGFSYGQTWLDKQNSKDFVPTLIVVGDTDSIVPEYMVKLEMISSGNELLKLPGGHAGPVLDDKLVKTISSSIRSNYNKSLALKKSCGSVFQ